ncbi:PREDICTED: prostate and testis expressed protein 2-like [Elephantulus edwardii]|uniref:prostate and testis expressed protein 2-like n=1 Tax=Elephantulus edwardii TaxID=28737 RepID=UPI0003F0717C|nr:PREDICTED: prostate and testis expressed protein 2-like [Elephantulus edwardii]
MACAHQPPIQKMARDQWPPVLGDGMRSPAAHTRDDTCLPRDDVRCQLTALGGGAPPLAATWEMGRAPRCLWGGMHPATCSFGTATYCFICRRYHLGKCSVIMKSCHLKYKQSCAIENIHVITKKGESHYLYSRLSCMYNCEDINFLDNDKRTELICCIHSNYCNLP